MSLIFSLQILPMMRNQLMKMFRSQNRHLSQQQLPLHNFTLSIIQHNPHRLQSPLWLAVPSVPLPETYTSATMSGGIRSDSRFWDFTDGGRSRERIRNR